MYKNVTNIPLLFGGGQNTLGSPMNIAENESPNCKNVYSNITNVLFRRNGYEQLGIAASGSTGNGLLEFWKNSETSYLLCYIDDYLYKIDKVSGEYDGTLDNVSFATAMSNAQMEFVQFNDAGVEYVIMATHNRDTLQKWNGVDSATTDLSSDADLVKPKYIIAWKGYIFCANIANYESRTYYNKNSGAVIGSADWSSTDYQTIRTHDGDYITGQALLKGRLYTFKRNSIHRWTYYGGTPLFGIKEAISGVGTTSSKSIVRISHPKYGEVLVFLSSEGKYYIFDGSQIYPISLKVENDNGAAAYTLDRLNRTNIKDSCAIDFKSRHWYTCWTTTSSLNNHLWVWDYYSEAFWSMDGINASAVCTAEHAGRTTAFFIPQDGTVYEYDRGNNDDGANIGALYETNKISAKNNPILKSQKYVEIHTKNIPLSSFNLYTKSDWTSSWGTANTVDLDGGGFILGTSVLNESTLGGEIAVVRTIDLPVINHYEQFRIQSNNADIPWEIYGMDIVTKGIGYGKA